MLELRQLSKEYDGRTVLDSVTQCFGTGIYAILGPAGAGKSTLLNILAGFTPPSDGSFTFLGKSPERHVGEYLKEVGYLPTNFCCCECFTGRQMLACYAILKGWNTSAAYEEQVEELLERLELKNEMNCEIRWYTKGMRQRLGIIQALLGNPHILLLDEPLEGLEPEYRAAFCHLLEERKRDCLILYAACSDPGEMVQADHLFRLRNGRLIPETAGGQDLIPSGLGRIDSRNWL